MENGKYPYQKQWEDYRQKSKHALWAWFIGSPIICLTIFSFKHLSENFVWLLIVIFLLVIIVFGWFSLRATGWKCPRCTETFRNKMLFAQIIAADCRNCGLIKYEGSTFKTF